MLDGLRTLDPSEEQGVVWTPSCGGMGSPRSGARSLFGERTRASRHRAGTVLQCHHRRGPSRPYRASRRQRSAARAPAPRGAQCPRWQTGSAGQPCHPAHRRHCCEKSRLQDMRSSCAWPWDRRARQEAAAQRQQKRPARGHTSVVRAGGSARSVRPTSLIINVASKRVASIAAKGYHSCTLSEQAGIMTGSRYLPIGAAGLSRTHALVYVHRHTRYTCSDGYCTSCCTCSEG